MKTTGLTIQEAIQSGKPFRKVDEKGRSWPWYIVDKRGEIVYEGNPHGSPSFNKADFTEAWWEVSKEWSEDGKPFDGIHSLADALEDQSELLIDPDFGDK